MEGCHLITDVITVLPKVKEVTSQPVKVKQEVPPVVDQTQTTIVNQSDRDFFTLLN